MKKTQEKSEPVNSMFSEQDSKTMQGIMLKIMSEGFVPKAKLIEEFGDSATTKAVAILHKSYRALVESREPWEGKEVNGFKMAERRFSQPEIKKLPPALAFLPELFKQQNNKYGDYKPLAVRCRWTTPVLGGLPCKTEDGEQINCFEKNWTGKDIVIQRFGLRAMLRRALELSNRSGYACDRFGFETITVRDPKITHNVRGITDRDKGLGTCKSECLAAGTEFVIRATIPTTYISPNDYVAVLKLAGQMVGLSPGRSAGYGDYEVLGVEPS
jgi:hypothetical protein